jgi:hypothetical protein
MSTSLVIVAIPEEQDRVWQVSSEQVPHLTLLYLGDDVTQVQHVDQIEQFVEHAVTLSEHGPFYLDVKRRGVLGPNEADVLFFNERSWNLKWIKQFRGQLLQNDAVRTAFDSAAQFGAVQEWLPHLTLGSPDAPAQPIPKDGFDHPFYSVCFDRIAVWTQEYAGPEFLLEWPDREFDGDLAVAYSDTKKAELIHYAMNGATLAPDPTERGAEFVEHFGVKGMRWGIRRRSSPGAEAFVRTGSTKQDHKDSIVDAKWLKADVRKNDLFMSKTDKKIFDSANKSLKSEAKAINKKPEYSGRQAKKELKRGDTPLRQQYDKEHQALFVKHLRQAAEKHLDPANKDVVSPSGKWEKDLRVFKDGSWMVGIRRTKSDGSVSHSAQDAAQAIEIVVQVRPIRDEDGLITNYELIDNPTGLTQTTVNAVHDTLSTGEQFVEHHGVKGMKWGVRKTSDHSNARGETVKAAVGGSFALLSPSFRKNVPGPTKTKVLVFGNYALLSGKVRRDLREASQKTAVQKADSQWEKGLRDGSAFVAVNNKMADHFNAHIGEVNAKHPSDFTKDTKNFDDPSTYGPKYKSYMKDVDSLTRDSVTHAVNELNLTNPSGTKEVEIVSHGMPGDFSLVPKTVKHAAKDEKLDFKVKYTTDTSGRVTGVILPDEEGVNAVHDTLSNGAAFVEGLVHASVLDNASVAAQIKAKIQSILDDVTGDGDGDVKLFGDPLVRTKIQSVLQDFYQDPNVDNAVVYDALGEKFLEHFGVKGMRWGVRKADPIKSRSGHTIIRGKAKVNVEGGGGHPAHPDAIKVAEAKTKLKKSGAAALSNEELRTVANRLQLEGQVHTLIKTKGKKFVDRHLEEQGNQLVRTGLREGAKRGIKRAARVAGTAAIVAA